MVTIEFLTLEARILSNPENSLLQSLRKKISKEFFAGAFALRPSLDSRRTLADTTAESATSVKHTNAI
jgi:hypothetical protein